MHTKIFLTAITLSLFSLPVYAADEHSGHVQQSGVKPKTLTVHEHSAGPFHMFRLESDYGAGQEGPVASWDFEGWYGGDYNKLWLKSEGERSDGSLEQAEFWALYSRNIAEFWDAQIGIRHDTQPASTSYLALGFEGLAPYFIETEVHLFVSDEGDFTARLRREHDLLITQRLILQPYGEINLSAQDVEEQEIGAGFTEGEIGLQTRYEITRKFAPYVDLRYERKFGETASIAEDEGEDNDDFVAALGIRFMF
jgi:copper resistance protein B